MSGRVIGGTLGALVAGVLLCWLLPKFQYIPPPLPHGAGERGGSPARGPQRVICMSPAVTEIVYALGQGERVAGISNYSSYPPEAREKPRCGGFFNPNLERILALRPDLIIAQGRAEKVLEFASERGLEVLRVEFEDLESVFVATRNIGRVLLAEEEAELLCADVRLQLAEVKLQVKDKPRPRTFVVVAREPGSLRGLQTVGPGSFLNDLLELAGGENVFSDMSRSYATVSKETLIQRQPEVIVELHGEGILEPADVDRILEIWDAMPGLPAVRNGRVYAVGSTFALIPGPRMAELAKKLAAILHETGDR